MLTEQPQRILLIVTGAHLAADCLENLRVLLHVERIVLHEQRQVAFGRLRHGRPTGSATIARVPPPALASNRRLPPCSLSITLAASGTPKPVPRGFVEAKSSRASRVRCSDIPGPRSAI